MQFGGFEGNYGRELVQGSLLPLFPLECCQERIYYRLVSMKMNGGLKDKIPCIPFLDMLVTFHVLIQGGEEQICSLRVTNEIAENWGIDTRVLYSLARNNTKQLFPEKVCRLRDMVEELCGEAGSRTEELSGLVQERWYLEPYVLTNRIGINGAAAVLYRGSLRRISDGFDGDCYVLPSSVHELLVLPVEEGTDLEGDLRRMVREVNDTYVSKEDFLSDKVYRYDRERDCIKICPSQEYA